VGTFWTDAQSIFETAADARRGGSPDCHLAILIGPQGEIHVRDAAGWALPGLLAEHGARTVYRLSREGGRVRLEGRSGSLTCLLQAEEPAAAARHLLACRPAAAPGWNPPGTALLAEGAHGPAGSPAGNTWTESR
jgi:hypothetical protein